MKHAPAVPRAGYGSRVAWTPVGFTYSTPPQTRNFQHPFRPFLIGNGLQFSKGIMIGTTQSYEPVITGASGGSGTPISGGTSGVPPTLALDSSVLATGATESWACIEFTPNPADGTTDGNTVVQMVHCDSPFSTNAAIARCPIALIVWQGKTAGQVFAIVYLNLRYYTMLPPVNAPRQYFFI